MQSNPGMPTSTHESDYHQPSITVLLSTANMQDARLSALRCRTCITCNMRRLSPNAGLGRYSAKCQALSRS